MFETERPELRQKHMRIINDVFDGFLLKIESGKAQKNLNLIDLETSGDSPWVVACNSRLRQQDEPKTGLSKLAKSERGARTDFRTNLGLCRTTT